MTYLQQKATVMRNWLRIRRAKGQEPTADAIWTRIKQNWPRLTSEDAEQIFQETY